MGYGRLYGVMRKKRVVQSGSATTEGAQTETGASGMNTGSAYTVKHIQKGPFWLFSSCMEAVWRTSMIRKCFLAFALVLSGCKYSEKDDGGAWKAADCFAILSGELSQNSIEIAKFNMEKCLCGRYSVSYKFFDDDACAISVWELDGRIRSIRIESHLPSAFLTYVIKDKYSLKKEAQWSYVEPQYGFCVQNNHRVSIPLERVLKLLNVKDVISYSRMNFGCPNAKTEGADYYVYWFKIVDRPNLVMNLTLFSKDSWLIEVFPAGSQKVEAGSR